MTWRIYTVKCLQCSQEVTREITSFFKLLWLKLLAHYPNPRSPCFSVHTENHISHCVLELVWSWDRVKAMECLPLSYLAYWKPYLLFSLFFALSATLQRDESWVTLDAMCWRYQGSCQPGAWKGYCANPFTSLLSCEQKVNFYGAWAIRFLCSLFERAYSPPKLLLLNT